jgi:hypothetical protein
VVSSHYTPALFGLSGQDVREKLRPVTSLILGMLLLRNMRRFYLAFPIRETVSLELSWSHYNVLARLDNIRARVVFAEGD